MGKRRVSSRVESRERGWVRGSVVLFLDEIHTKSLLLVCEYDYSFCLTSRGGDFLGDELKRVASRKTRLSFSR